MSDLSAKFVGLQSQLSSQHSELVQLLGWLRQDIADIKTDVDNIRVSAANTATWAQQTAGNTLDVYNRLNTLVALYSYLTQESEQGHDLIARINDLQYRTGLIQGHIDGIEGFLDPMGEQFDSMIALLTVIRGAVSTGQTPVLYSLVRTINSSLFVMYKAMTGNVGDWTGTTLMEYLSTINAATIQGADASETNGQTLGDILTEVQGIKECACETPPDGPCATGTPLDVGIADTPQELWWRKTDGNELLANASPLSVPQWFDPVAAGGPEGVYIEWVNVDAIIPLGVAEFCIQNGSTLATVFWFILDGNTEPAALLQGTVVPGDTAHFPAGINGPATWLALAVDQVPTDLASIKVIVFAAG